MTTMKYLYVIPYNAYVEGMQVVGRVFIKNMLYYVIQGKRFFDWKKRSAVFYCTSFFYRYINLL